MKKKHSIADGHKPKNLSLPIDVHERISSKGNGVYVTKLTRDDVKREAKRELRQLKGK